MSPNRLAAVLGTLVFGFHAALGDLYLSTGTVYDILCVFFTLAALLTYVNVRDGGADLGAKDIVKLLLLYGGALDSKEMAVSLPAALILYEAIFARQVPIGRLWRRALPVLLVAALSIAYLAVKLPVLSANVLYRPQLSPVNLFANLSRYLDMLIFQDQLAVVWLIGTVLAAVVFCLAARRPVGLFGLCYGFLALLPVATVAPRGGFVLYLPLVGFALFAGDILAAIGLAAMSVLPRLGGSPSWRLVSQASFFLIVAATLFVIHYRHWHDQTRDPGRVDQAMRETVDTLLAHHPNMAAGTRLFFLDDPLPKNRFTLLFLVQAAYHDPSLWVERQNNIASPVQPAEYAIFDYLISIRNGSMWEQRLPPIRWEGPPVLITFTPGVVHAGQTLQLRVGNYSGTSVDIEFQRISRFARSNGIALRWVNLGLNGMATIPVSRLEDPGSVQITAVRVSGNQWQKASGGFIIQ